MSTIAKSNKLLATLGSRGAFPLYKWIWSESPELAFEMSILDAPPNGVKDPRSGLWLPQTPKRRVAFLGITAHWVLCVRRDLEDFGIRGEYDWRQKFGDQFTFPGDSIWFPVESPTGWAVHRNPDESYTRRVVETIKKDRKLAQSAAEEAAKQESAAERRDKALRDEVVDQVREMLPARFGIPGSRSSPHWYRKANDERMIQE